MVSGILFGGIHLHFAGVFLDGVDNRCFRRIGYLGGVGSAGPFGAFTCGEGKSQERG